MTKQQKILTPIYAALWIAGAYVLYNDLFVWRKNDPSPAAIVAKAQQKAVR